MGLNYWLFVAATLTLTAFIGYGTFATARLLRVWRPDRNLLLLPEENVMRLLFILVCLILGRLSGLPPEQLGWVAPHPVTQVTLGTGIGLALGLFFFLTTRWVIRFTGQRFYSTVIIEYVVPGNLTEALLVTLALVPVVILEELLFRSLLLGGLAPILPVSGLVVGLGLLFGLLHSPQGLWGMAGASLAGILFGLLFLWQGSLLTPIIAHYLANWLQILLAMRWREPLADESREASG